MENVNKSIQLDIQDGPVRCILWGTRESFNVNYQLIKYYEQLKKISIVGFVTNDPLHSQIGGYEVITEDCINVESFDVVIIVSGSKAKVCEITKRAMEIGVYEYNIVPCRVMRLIGFSFYKYRLLKQNPPSIFAPSCWGGLTYNSLGLRFDSPMINMFEKHSDYIKLMANLKHYMSSELEYEKNGFDENQKLEYPIIRCDDILLHFNHYKSFEEANELWNRRKARIHWDNVFVMMFSESKDMVDQFCTLKYEKKVCFVPYPTEQKNVISIKYSVNSNSKDIPFWQIVNGMASGYWQYYDVIDLLLYNKITKVADFKTL